MTFHHINIIKETETEVEIMRGGFSDKESAISEVHDLLKSSNKNLKIGDQVITSKMCEAEIRQIVMFPKML